MLDFLLVSGVAGVVLSVAPALGTGLALGFTIAMGNIGITDKATLQSLFSANNFIGAVLLAISSVGTTDT